MKHRAPKPSLLAGLVSARDVLPRSPMSPGQVSEIYQNNTLLGRGTCIEAGQGHTKIVGYAQGGDAGGRIWEVRIPYTSLMQAKVGMSVPEDANIIYHPRGTSEHSALSRHCKK